MGTKNFSNKLSKWAMLIASIVLVLMWNSLRSNLSENFDNVEKALLKKQAILLNRETKAKDIEALLIKQQYADASGAHFIAQQLDSMLKVNTLENIEDLRKNRWKAPYTAVEASNSKIHKEKLSFMLEQLEQVADFKRADETTKVSTLTIAGNGTEHLTARVTDSETGKPCAGVLVRIKEHYVSLTDSTEEAAKDSIVGFARTDDKGVVTFNGLQEKGSYSVLPIKKGFKYGNAQGTLHGDMASFRDNKSSLSSKLLSIFSSKKDCNFKQEPLNVELLDRQTLRNIKEDQTFIVRTPHEFIKKFSSDFFTVMALWWILVAIAAFRKRKLDNMLLASLMVLTEVCVLVMYGFNSPLTSYLHGADMAMGVIIGIVIIAMLMFFNIVEFYQGRVRLFGRSISFDPLESLSKGKISKGFFYLAVALLLTLALFPFGQEVGGMKVNLNLGFTFQPSEIAKYLIVIFMAAYFCQNAELITRYSEPGNFSLIGSKVRSLGYIILGMAVLVILYILLQDMGPAMVVIFTFLILYSIIKSRIDLSGKSPEERLKAILTCDLAMLIYGTVSFGLVVFLGSRVGITKLAALSWFVVWILWGRLRRRQLIETPILFNIIVTVFVFSHSLASSGSSVLGEIGERLEARTSMCENPWGELGLDGNEMNPAEKSQIAEGMWGLATGGLTGQGLGNGDAGFIPAYHTDMVLESIGENMGFLGILLVMAVYIMLLSRTIKAGYGSKHPFAMFLCTGIAIATAVQLFIISLGSTGVIPLTGVTVPLLSYGKVSMILNLFAFGMVLSISAHSEDTNKGEIHKKYQYSLGLLNISFFAIMLVVVGTFFKYQVLQRDSTLVKPLFVKNSEGAPIIEYNPRIALLTRKLPMGDIYDRNGILLATSNPSKLAEKNNLQAYSSCGIKVDTSMVQSRYYPFKENLFFMVGDFNSRLMYSSPYCYMAEHRLLDSIRGYDNRKYDSQHNPQRVNLPSYKAMDNTGEGRFTAHEFVYDGQNGVMLRDYSVLLPYLKAGRNSQRVKDLIARNDAATLEPKDVQLTVDAVLQTQLQTLIKEHVANTDILNHQQRLRISAVVLDADNGDLLASACYPLPNYDLLKSLPSDYRRYEDRDGKVGKDFKAFTDMDLGLSFASHPGSSAKIMSAMSGFLQIGDKVNSEDFNVFYDQKVGTEPVGWVNIHDAIVLSSNCYFINLVNKHNLYPTLQSIYGNVGVRINGAAPYHIDYAEPSAQWMADVTRGYSGATDVYNKYIEKYKAGRYKGRDAKMSGPKAHPSWMWTWGQGGLDATPVAMARVASAVVNNGTMPVTRFLMGDTVRRVNVVDPKTHSILRLKELMKEESLKHAHINESLVGGKTGTAERISSTNGRRTLNDAWYVCFYDGSNHKYAIAVRVERIPGRNYAAKIAAPIVSKIILPTLRAHKYIK